MTDNVSTIMTSGGSVVMLFVVQPVLFYTVGGLVAITCVVVIVSTLLGCLRRERRLEDLKTRAQRRKKARESITQGCDCN